MTGGPDGTFSLSKPIATSNYSSQLAFFDGTVGYRFLGRYANTPQLDPFETRFQKQIIKDDTTTYLRKWPYMNPNLPRLIYGVAIYDPELTRSSDRRVLCQVRFFDSELVVVYRENY